MTNIVHNHLKTGNKLKRNIKKEWLSNRYLYFMSAPAVAALVIFSYLPMFGLIMAFQDYSPQKGIQGSPFVALKNFEFLFATTDAWRITRNTVLYNTIFIVLNLVFAVALAIVISQINNRFLAKVLQTIYIMPYFLSMAIVAIIVFSVLSARSGFLNIIMKNFGMETRNWYMVKEPWPYILILVNVWKGVGYSAVVYLASIAGISNEYYEAAMLDGASKPQQVKYITIPHLKPMISILLIMSIGSIFRGDFGLFYLVPQNSGPLYAVTDVIDTYIYRAMTTLNNNGMATAAGLYQSIVCLILVLVANKIVARIEPDNAMF
ncbi:MAG: ABC transporter permease subunit [Clostridiaceae bacterium]|nr:ABC transporter permease subunit [Clostridiaceae bacterium]